MEKAIAHALWQVCRREGDREFRLWNAAHNAKVAEAHRLRCGDWAIAANELYAIWARQAQKQKKEER